MQYLYFEDWSIFTHRLDSKGIVHGGKIIKIFSSPKDPRGSNPAFKVVEADDSPLHGETFDYARGTWTGEQIEEDLAGLEEQARRSVRALFRLANDGSLAFCETAMGLRHNGDWLIDHPLQVVDGIDKALRAPKVKSSCTHLDIFTEKSLSRLAGIVDISEKSEELIPMDVGRKMKRELQAEINSAGKERK